MTESVFHNSRDSRYRCPGGAQPVGGSVSLSIDAPELAKCTLRLWADDSGERRLPMAFDGGKFSAKLTLPDEAGLLWYFFIIELDGAVLYLGAPDDGLGGCGTIRGHEPPSWQITAYSPSAAPEWYKNALVYQIFPDRFRRGEDWRIRRETARRDESRKGPRRIWHEDWNDTPFYTKNGKGQVTRWDFFGGTLSGICEKLPYLKELGVGAVYLNPIFSAASNHRYDTADYMELDPLLGGGRAFENFCAEAHACGIRVILDGVFSHTGADSRYFDYYGSYGGGAYSDPGSPYRSWYRFRRWPDDYESWWGVGDLPNVDEEDPSYKDFIVTGRDSVARTWLRRGADGWRLDVADELPDSFIASFKTAIREEKPDSLLLGEVWEDASNKRSYGVQRRYLLGSELDSTMHYPFREAVTDFLTGKTDAHLLRRRLEAIAENYPPEAQYAALNLMGSHDRARAITVLGGAPENPCDMEKADYRLDEEHYILGASRLMLSALLQYACPGVPCVYYGDEAGLEGYEDPYNRAPYPWGREDRALLNFYKKLGRLYASVQELKSGKFSYESPDADVFVCRRWSDGGAYAAVINRSRTEKQLELRGEDLLTGTLYTDRLRLPPLGGALLKLEG
ncbi:MAG: alpha-amylase family glycosyl hydrolase [Candidatus Heteroscillospira sp.]|jgi:glycosidase